MAQKREKDLQKYIERLKKEKAEKQRNQRFSEKIWMISRYLII